MANTYPGKRPLADKYYTCQLSDISSATVGVIAITAQGEWIGWRGGRSATTTGTAAITVALNGTTISDAAGSFTAGGVGDEVSVDFDAVAVKDGDVITFTSDGGSSTTSVGGITAIVREL